MDRPFRFLDLPRELREGVYTVLLYQLPGARPDDLLKTSSKPAASQGRAASFTTREAAAPLAVPLLYSCRQISHELQTLIPRLQRRQRASATYRHIANLAILTHGTPRAHLTWRTPRWTAAEAPILEVRFYPLLQDRTSDDDSATAVDAPSPSTLWWALYHPLAQYLLWGRALHPPPRAADDDAPPGVPPHKLELADLIAHQLTLLDLYVEGGGGLAFSKGQPGADDDDKEEEAASAFAAEMRHMLQLLASEPLWYGRAILHGVRRVRVHCKLDVRELDLQSGPAPQWEDVDPKDVT